MKKFWYVANWKSFLTLPDASRWLSFAAKDLALLSQTDHLVVCPDFVTAGALHAMLPLPFVLGAQDCSAMPPGAHTGEVSLEALKACDVKLCIIGHHERRAAPCESPETILAKMYRALAYDLVPLLCVSDQYEKELEPLSGEALEGKFFLIAYEPIKAIGTGWVPGNKQVAEVFEAISHLLNKKMIRDDQYNLLYGGSVDDHSARKLRSIERLDGLLIGRASTDFQLFKNIVLSISSDQR